MGRLLGYFFLLLNILCALWLGLCHAASVTKPGLHPYLALFSLTTPIAIVVNFIFLLLWLTVHKWRALLPALTLALCYKLIIAVFAFNFFSTSNFSAGQYHVKVMLWNVHGMGIYDERNNTHALQIMEKIQAEEPDVLCATEYYVRREDSMKPYSRKIMDDNGFKYFSYISDNTLGTEMYLGTSAFSKYPLSNMHTYLVGRSIYLLQVDVQLPAKMIRLFSMHLYSFRFNDNDRAHFAEVKATRNVTENDMARSKILVRQFDHNYKERGDEADNIARIIAHSPYPVVVCGDFNDLPASYTYTTIRGSLNDAFVDRGAGIGRTYNQIFPTLRIDHIFYNPGALKIIGFKCPSVTTSDHNPVIANFQIK
jgi:endonuclease/exonuclease/phosphatase (EEP) superfamily protein YafD